jgi:hypothetical protein
MAPEFGVGSTNYSLRTCLGKFRMVMLGLYRPVSVARASFALPRSHHGKVRCKLIMVSIYEINCTLHLSKGQPEDGPTNWAETCRWNYNKFNKIQSCV